MILFAEINKTDEEHAVINGCLLQMLCHIFKDSTVEFWGARRHFDRLPPLGPDCKISIHDVNVLTPRDGNKLYWIYKYCTEIGLIIKVLRRARRGRAGLLFFSSLSVFGNYALSLLAPFSKKVPIIITLHGELEYIRQASELPRSLKLFGRVLKQALSRSAPSVKFLVLGSFIREQIIEWGILTPLQILSIEHPYVFPPLEKTVRSRFPSFGHVGIALRSKHSDLFFKLAERFQEEIKAGKVSFRMVGRVWNDLKGSVNSLVEYANTDTFLSRDVFNMRLEEISYSVFLYGDEQYTLTGSGAIMDAIAFEKPILCLKSRYFERLFAKAPAEPGWIFDDFESLAKKVGEIIAGYEADDYSLMVQRVATLKVAFSVEQVEKELAAQLAYLPGTVSFGKNLETA